MKLKKNSHTRPSKKFLIYSIIIGIMLIIGLLMGLRATKWIFGSNININNGDETIIYIPNNATYDEVVELISREKVFISRATFEWVAQIKGLKGPIKGGRYKLRQGMSNNELVNMLRAGLQSPVMLTFNNIRTKEALVHIVAGHLDIDSTELVGLLNNDLFLKQYDLSSETALVLFLPNSYQFYWNTKVEKFIDRMHNEYEKFWNADRKAKAESKGLTPVEVSILAAIVDEETVKEDEKPVVAGLYLNRLRKGIRLQADPTVKYAIGNFAVNRILNKDMQIDSPYNTYLYAGLPPGPIRIPSISGIESVLNATQHSYLYMCAKEDFSGYHNFAKTLEQHNVNAAKYRRELNKRRIYR